MTDNMQALAERDGESIMAILKQNIETERPWYKFMYNNQGSWTMEEESQLNDMFAEVKAARPNKRAKPASSSGQTREERLHDIERYLFEKSGEIAVRDCCHTDLKAYFRPTISEELPWYMFLHRSANLWSEAEEFQVFSLLKLAQSFTQVSFLEDPSPDPWLHVCDFVFKHKHEMAAATGKTMFEKLQALGTKEAKSAFSALVGVAKNIRATELAPEDLSPNCELALKARVCLMILWIYEGVQASCVESVQQGDHSAAFQRLATDGVLLNWRHTLNQLVEHGLPSVFESDKLTSLEKESPFHFPEAEERIQTLKHASYRERIRFLEELMDNQQVAGKNTILRQMYMLFLVKEIFFQDYGVKKMLGIPVEPVEGSDCELQWPFGPLSKLSFDPTAVIAGLDA